MRRSLQIIVPLIFLVVISFCPEETSATVTTSTQETFPQRIVSLGPINTEMSFF
jgi:hypothetical protein